jgi:hypothetical protein
MMALLALLIGLTAIPSEAAADQAVRDWRAHVDAAIAAHPPLPSSAPLSQQIERLVILDEVTRQHDWRAFDPALTPEQQRSASEAIGMAMRVIDAENTATLKRLLPKDGWFRNSRDGAQETHGAWLIAQHSPDKAFREQALAAMRMRITDHDVDPMDFALITDRVAVFKGDRQVYGSQAGCTEGKLTIAPLIDPDNVDARRRAIGWSKRLVETMGDLNIGKPCAM